ncbi:MAG TPA: carboxylating nicotinate-nucleotide diphosphorylase [Actinomycetota bacterium]|nr:carboxylating nicotinate-nucleotide diphosphorylase [Actinomycetota bacterium]
MTTSADEIRSLVETALREDAPEGDLTAALTVPESATCRAELRAKAPGVLAGRSVASAVFDVVSEQDGLGQISIEWHRDDGERVEPGDLIADAHGPARSILRAERVAINFLAHLSGVASLTRTFVDAAAPARILCTRKTTPGLRSLERDAVLAGGGVLHRASLSDAVLIKDNHLWFTDGVANAVAKAKEGGVPVEVEVESLAQLEEAVDAGADRILLDNPSPELVEEAIATVEDPDRLEISGGVTLDSVPLLAEAGTRVISVGRITHSAPSLDLSLEVVDVDQV